MSSNYLLTSFFKMLSQRYSKENDLSDITWSMLQCVPEFAALFINFLEVNICTPFEVSDVQREYIIDRSNNDSRIDFMIRISDTVILLENKIGDTNYHFEQYDNAINSTKDRILQNQSKVIRRMISYRALTNQDILNGENLGFKVYFWTDFVEFLKLETIKLSGSLKEIMDYYLTYLQEVIYMPEIKEIRIQDDTLYSLKYLNNLIEKIIKSSKGDGVNFRYDYYGNKNRSFGNYWSGHGYSVNSLKNNKSAWLLFYFQYDHEGVPTFIIDMQIDWNNELISKMSILKGNTNELYKITIDKEGLGFIMHNSEYEKFKTLDMRKQEEFLISYFNNVNEIIGSYLKDL